MNPRTVGILHPGQMGAAIGASLRSTRCTVLWSEQERSDATTRRAEIADLIAVPSVVDVVRRSAVVISICPPSAALDVAREVAAAGRPALYIDANAVAPATMDAIADLLGKDRVVDAAVIGPPPWEAGRTTMYVSGPRADEVHSLFEGTTLRVESAGARIGQASAVKVCFALQSKALPTIWALIAATAESYGVTETVRTALADDDVDLPAALQELARTATAKAWRWDGEMAESAAALADAGLPSGIPDSAREIYRRAAAAFGPNAEAGRDRAALAADWVAAMHAGPAATAPPRAGRSMQT